MHALQAITTKYLAPTNTRGARVKATASAGSVIIAWDHALNPVDNHYAAALALTDRMEWETDDGFRRPHAFGALPDGGYVLAFLTR